MFSSYFKIVLGVILLLVIIYLLRLEQKAAKRKKIKLYTISDTITNLSCGMMERIFDFFVSVVILYFFHLIYLHVAPYQIPLNIGTWIIGLVVFDFIAYWFHRLSHEVNFLWAAHIVHHQSEELNLSTVFRVSFFAVIFRAFFFVWMALIGFDVFTITSCSVFLGLYQLFTHSRVIGKLGFVEKILTTPSAHRVHHGINTEYMDRNYSHIFIIWDKLFGTFIEETKEPAYGITSGFESANPFKANFSYWNNLMARAKKTTKFSDKIKLFLKGPEWTPNDVSHLPNEYKVDENGERISHSIPISSNFGKYIIANSLITFAAFIFLLLQKMQYQQDVSVVELLLNFKIISLVGFILFSVYSFAKMIDTPQKAFIYEIIRIILLVFVVLVIFFNSISTPILLISAILLFGSMVLWIYKINSGINYSNQQ